MRKILLIEGVHPKAEASFKKMGLSVEYLQQAVEEDDILKRLKNDTIFIGCRSRTQITEKILHNSQIQAIGAFCIGTNQIDLKAAELKGIPVFNAPYSNTRSVAELVVGLIISLSRKFSFFSSLAHQGVWNKTSKDCFEVRGKTLGIIGYGHIGSQVSVLAEALGMKIYYYDILAQMPIGNAKPCASLKELLKKSDFISLHVPASEQTNNMISQKQLALMKKGSYLINTSRGSVVDIQALHQALKDQHLRGAAVDVFPKEPLSNQDSFQSILQEIPEVLLTPHIGGSTEEAQEAIAHEVSASLEQYLFLGNTEASVNFPKLQLPPIPEKTKRLSNVHKNQPGVLGQINQLVSETGINIKAQYLATNENIGYLVMDVEKEQVSDLCQRMSELPSSLRTREIS